VKAELAGFGVLVVEGRRYENDVVISAGRVAKRDKKPSKAYRDRFGHTPLSADEAIPWSGDRLVIGTGSSGQLPVMDEVLSEAERRGITIVAVPTREACRLLADMPRRRVNAILHATC
jgi:hypothetical protein